MRHRKYLTDHGRIFEIIFRMKLHRHLFLEMERGRFADFLKKCGPYRRIYRNGKKSTLFNNKIFRRQNEYSFGSRKMQVIKK